MKFPLITNWSGRVALALAVAGLCLQALPRRMRRAALVPAQSVILAPLRLVGGVGTAAAGLSRENRRLADVATRLSVQNARLQSALRGLAELGDYDPALVRAPVIARDLSSFEQYLVISRGTEDGVRLAAPVLSPDGVVGKVIRAEARTALVQSIHASDFRVAVLDTRSRTPGLVGPGRRGGLIVHFAAKNADFRAGDTLVTAGLGGVFPQGLPVGTVASATPDPDALFLDVTVRPFAEVSRLPAVFVLRLPESDPNSSWLDNIGVPDSVIPEEESAP
jgi:rod shape-determining protein MreC